MRKLIIGCGYLGRRVASAWLKEGHEVVAMTRSDAHADEFRAEGIEPFVGDVTKPATLAGLPAADVLLYSVGFDRSAGLSQHTVYIDGLVNVLQTIGKRVGRVIYISSSSVYGQQDGEWIDETSPTIPTTPGGQVCLAAEGALREYFPSQPTVGKSAAVVLRLSGIYGPGRLLRRIEAVRSQAPVAGNPQAWLNLIHVDDAVAVVRTVAKAASTDSTYLASDDRPISREEYYGRLAALVGVETPHFHSTDEPGRHATGLGKRCRNHRLREDFGIELQYPTIETGLPHALAGET